MVAGLIKTAQPFIRDFHRRIFKAGGNGQLVTATTKFADRMQLLIDDVEGEDMLSAYTLGGVAFGTNYMEFIGIAKPMLTMPLVPLEAVTPFTSVGSLTSNVVGIHKKGEPQLLFAADRSPGGVYSDGVRMFVMAEGGIPLAIGFIVVQGGSRLYGLFISKGYTPESNSDRKKFIIGLRRLTQEVVSPSEQALLSKGDSWEDEDDDVLMELPTPGVSKNVRFAEEAEALSAQSVFEVPDSGAEGVEQEAGVADGEQLAKSDLAELLASDLMIVTMSVAEGVMSIDAAKGELQKLRRNALAHGLTEMAEIFVWLSAFESPSTFVEGVKDKIASIASFQDDMASYSIFGSSRSWATMEFAIRRTNKRKVGRKATAVFEDVNSACRMITLLEAEAPLRRISGRELLNVAHDESSHINMLSPVVLVVQSWDRDLAPKEEAWREGGPLLHKLFKRWNQQQSAQLTNEEVIEGLLN